MKKLVCFAIVFLSLLSACAPAEMGSISNPIPANQGGINLKPGATGSGLV